jgi:rhamnogalacturonan endolyase
MLLRQFVVYASATVLLAAVPRVFGAFGVTSSGGYYTVDTGADLVFKVNQSNGDVTSLFYNSVEYQATPKCSQLTSGLGAASVTATTYGTNFIKLTIVSTDTNIFPTPVTHYLMAHNGESIIYLATYATSVPSDATLRWITRMKSTLLPNGPPPSDNRGYVACLENCAGGGDVNLMADGTTRSKYYGRHRAMDLTCNGATGSGVGVWMVFGSRESSAGGPFFRDTENQCDTDQQVYNVMFSGHAQTEDARLNVLYGPYALVFNNGTPPALPLDFSWIENGGLNLTGWVASTNRGAVKGLAWGIPAGFQGVVKFANTNAQYWAVVGTNGNYLTPLMKPGDYTAILCKGELEVATNSVTVGAGQTNTLNLVSGEAAPTYIFKIGEWDGTPLGFLNADKILTMHPSDVRMSNWISGTFIVGVDSDSKFPMVAWKDAGISGPIPVQFVLAANQIQNLTLRYSITCSHAGGRPKPTIGGWTPSNPAAPDEPDTRAITLGTWRGNNTPYSFTVPSSAFVVGTNTLTLSVISGSEGTPPWLSPSCAYDAVELDIPNTSPATPDAPVNPTATALNGSQINLAWTDNSTNEVNFLIERSTNGVNFNLVAAVTAGVTNCTDTGLLPGTTNFYRVRTFNAGGYSAYSSIVSAVTPLPRIQNASLSGGDFIFSGNGGPASAMFYLLVSTNIATPLNQWLRAATNYFDSNGNFIFTNEIQTDSPQGFFRLQLP